MWLFIKLAWRNIFRNKRRTILTGTAIGIGLASILFTDALLIGMKENMIRSATASFMGEGQIHAEGFRESMEIEKTIRNLDWVATHLEAEAIVDRFTLRTLAFGMINSPADVQAVSVIGVNPETEQYLSQINDAIIEGEYFQGTSEHDIIIGSELAEILEVTPGDRVVITVAQAHTGELAQEMFRISGIYFFNSAEMDKGMAFIRLGIAQSMCGLNDQVHEIALTFTDSDFGSNKELAFWETYSRDGNLAQGWTSLMPQLEAALELTSYSTTILGSILFVVVALAIINSLFMSLYERIFEFGVLRAVGTRPVDVAKLIVFESGALAVIAIIIGIILGLAITAYFSIAGIDYIGIEWSGVTFRELLYPVLHLYQFIIYPLALLILTMLVGLYPARYAAKLSPAEAMRRSF